MKKHIRTYTDQNWDEITMIVHGIEDPADIMKAPEYPCPMCNGTGGDLENDCLCVTLHDEGIHMIVFKDSNNKMDCIFPGHSIEVSDKGVLKIQ